MPKQDDDQAPAGVAHSFRVTHVMRPGGQLGGGAEVTTGHLNAHDAMDWIRAQVKDHHLGLRDLVHAHYGVHPDVAAQLTTTEEGGHIQATLDAVADPPAEAAPVAPGAVQEVTRTDASPE